MLSEDMWDNLDMFFAWSQVNSPDDVYYPHQTPFRRLLGGGIGTEGLSDDEAATIDSALAELGKENAEALWIVKRIHKDRKTLRWLESKRQGDRKRNGRLLAEAHQFIRGFIVGKHI